MADDRNQDILAAWKEGTSVYALARVYSMSPARVQQVIGRALMREFKFEQVATSIRNEETPDEPRLEEKPAKNGKKRRARKVVAEPVPDDLDDDLFSLELED